MGHLLVFAHQGGGGDLGDHHAGVQAGPRGQETRQPVAQRRIDQHGDAALGDGADLGHGKGDHVGGKGDRLGMEVAA